MPWAAVRRGWARRDFNLGDTPIRVARELLGAQMPPCPACGSPTGDHTWVCIERADEIGWVSVCEDCQRQVGYAVDKELTTMHNT